MSKQNNQDPLKTRPAEQHTTAAWANIEKLQEVSKVTIPSESQVENAKEWVDTNQK